MTASPKTFASNFFSSFEPPAAKRPLDDSHLGPGTRARNAERRRKQFLDDARQDHRYIVTPAADRMVRSGLPAACTRCPRLTTAGGACPGVTAAAGPACADSYYIAAIDAATFDAYQNDAGIPERSPADNGADRAENLQRLAGMAAR